MKTAILKELNGEEIELSDWKDVDIPTDGTIAINNRRFLLDPPDQDLNAEVLYFCEAHLPAS